MILDLEKRYDRKGDILFQDEVAIVWFIADSFIDLEDLTHPQIKYMQKYMHKWPNRFETL